MPLVLLREQLPFTKVYTVQQFSWLLPQIAKRFWWVLTESKEDGVSSLPALSEAAPSPELPFHGLGFRV